METMTVRVLNRGTGRGYTYPTVHEIAIPVDCWCGQRRGTPTSKRFSEDGGWLTVDVWENPCGHVDTYTALLAARRAIVDANGDQVSLPSHLAATAEVRAWAAERVPAGGCGHYIVKAEADAGFTTCVACVTFEGTPVVEYRVSKDGAIDLYLYGYNHAQVIRPVRVKRVREAMLAELLTALDYGRRHGRCDWHAELANMLQSRSTPGHVLYRYELVPDGHGRSETPARVLDGQPAHLLHLPGKVPSSAVTEWLNACEQAFSLGGAVLRRTEAEHAAARLRLKLERRR